MFQKEFLTVCPILMLLFFVCAMSHLRDFDDRADSLHLILYISENIFEWLLLTYHIFPHRIYILILLFTLLLLVLIAFIKKMHLIFFYIEL